MKSLSDYNYEDSTENTHQDVSSGATECLLKDEEIIDKITKNPENYSIEVIQYPHDYDRWMVVLMERERSMESFGISMYMESQDPKGFDIEEAYKDAALLIRTNKLFEAAEHYASWWAYNYDVTIYFNRRDGVDRTGYVGWVASEK